MNKPNSLQKKIDQIIQIIDIPEVDYHTNNYRIIDDKIIKYIEKVIRRSYEYKDFIQYLKLKLNIDRCTYYEGYSMDNGLTIELHHSPFTLYQYVETVCRKHLDINKGCFDPLDVAEEVTKLHHMFYVPLVPLNPTAHQLVHSGELKIHPDLVLSTWEPFVEEYKQWLPDSVINTLKEIEDLKKEKSDKIPKILQKKETILQLPWEKLNNKFIKTIIDKKIDNINLEKLDD